MDDIYDVLSILWIRQENRTVYTTINFRFLSSMRDERCAVCAGSLEVRLHELMMQINEADNGGEDELTLAVQSKGAFVSDERALNEVISKIIKRTQLAAIIGNVEFDEFESSEDEL